MFNARLECATASWDAHDTGHGWFWFWRLTTEPPNNITKPTYWYTSIYENMFVAYTFRIALVIVIFCGVGGRAAG